MQIIFKVELVPKYFIIIIFTKVSRFFFNNNFLSNMNQTPAESVLRIKFFTQNYLKGILYALDDIQLSK